MAIGYLGPRGTFTEQAGIYFLKKELENKKLVPYNTIIDLLMSVNNGSIEKAVVPIENTTEGTVNTTVDTLIFDTDLYIQSLVAFPIKQSLMINKKNENKTINKILSHPQGIAQCRKFLNNKYKNIKISEVSSTAEASRIVSEEEIYSASIGTDLCGEIYDLEIINNNIQDNDNNKTLFILVSKNKNNTPELNKKMSLAFSTFNKPGDLYKILSIFTLWDINITKIFSRPMRNKNGEYVFFIDIENFTDIQNVIDAFTMVKRKTNFFKILGSYQVVEL